MHVISNPAVVLDHDTWHISLSAQYRILNTALAVLLHNEVHGDYKPLPCAGIGGKASRSLFLPPITAQEAWMGMFVEGSRDPAFADHKFHVDVSSCVAEVLHIPKEATAIRVSILLCTGCCTAVSSAHSIWHGTLRMECHFSSSL